MRYDTLCLQLLEYPVESQQVMMFYLDLPDLYRKKIRMRDHSTLQSLITLAKEVERKLETEESVSKARDSTRHVSSITNRPKTSYNKPKDYLMKIIKEPRRRICGCTVINQTILR